MSLRIKSPNAENLLNAIKNYLLTPNSNWAWNEELQCFLYLGDPWYRFYLKPQIFNNVLYFSSQGQSTTPIIDDEKLYRSNFSGLLLLNFQEQITEIRHCTDEYIAAINQEHNTEPYRYLF